MRALRWILLAPPALLVLLVLIVNFRAAPIDHTPPPSREMVIPMPDGTARTLGELVDAVEADASGEGERRDAGDDEATARDDAGGDAAAVEGTGAPAPIPPAPPALDMDARDLIALAEYQLGQGRPDEAIALLRSVPEDHPRYGFAMRRIGWDGYTRGMDAPSRGVAFVNRSIRSDPWSGNTWQDAARVYGSQLGLPVQ